MKLLALISIIFCVVVYANANEQKGAASIEDKSLLPHWLHHKANSQVRTAASQADSASPQLSFNVDDNLPLIDNGRTTVDLNGDVESVPEESDSLGNAQLNTVHNLDEQDFLGIYGNLYDNDGIGGAFRWKRKAAPMEPRVRLELEKQFGRNGFINGFMDLQQGSRGRVEPQIGASIGMRFRREAMIDETVEEINRRRRRDKILLPPYYIRC